MLIKVASRTMCRFDRFYSQNRVSKHAFVDKPFQTLLYVNPFRTARVRGNSNFQISNTILWVKTIKTTLVGKMPHAEQKKENMLSNLAVNTLLNLIAKKI